MSTKSKPGDGTHAKGVRGLPFGEAKRPALTVVRDAVRNFLAPRLR
ncbi:lariocidin/triculamin family lasso peptide core domain [Streptomyces sp. 8N706]